MSTRRLHPTPLNPVDLWHEEHVYFSRLLDLLGRQVEVFETGQRPNYPLMLDILNYLRGYSDRFHHPREELAFARLAEYCPDLGPVLANLRQEHRVIANAGQKLLDLLTAIVDDSMVPRADVEAAAATYLVYYRGHIAAEEHSVLVPAEDNLTQEDWDAVNAVEPDGPYARFGPDPEKDLRDLRHRIALES
jgi:hemerythrin-like domain-containing protein